MTVARKAKKTAKKSAAKKSAAKRSATKSKAKKKASKKASKKPASRKKASKKSAKKKTTKKKAAKKKAAKKKTTKKVSKKAAKKKATKKKATKKKAAKKKATKKKAAKKKATRKTGAANKKPRRRSANARKPVALTVGDPAPAFELDADNGKTYSLVRLHGKRVVLYFYPRDNTPGCTTEACDFRDLHDDFKSANTVVLGVSSDSLDSHKKFRKKLDLPFPLLTDPGNKVATAYGAYGKKKGKDTVGSIRSTFIISPAGRIEAMYTAVRVKGHAKTVLAQAQEAA